MSDPEGAVTLALVEPSALVSDEPLGLAPLPMHERANPARVYLESLASKNSQRAMRDALQRVLRVIGQDPSTWDSAAWWQMRPEHATTIRARLIRKFSVNTARVCLSALRGVLHQCFVLGYITGDRFERVTSWSAVLGGDEEPTGRMLTDDEIARVRAVCGRAGPFDAALNAALFDTAIASGARRDELAHLRVTDVSADARKLRIEGKRRKIRWVPLPSWAAGALEAWLAQRARFEFASESLFIYTRNGKTRGNGFSKWQIWRRLRDLGAMADVDFTPHDLRRTYLSTTLDQADVITVSKLAGHADPRTTARYDRRPEAVKIKAIEGLEKWGLKVAHVAQAPEEIVAEEINALGIDPKLYELGRKGRKR